MFKFKTVLFTIFSICLITLASCGTTKSTKEHIIIDTTPADSKPFEDIEILPEKDVPDVVVDTTTVPQPEINNNSPVTAGDSENEETDGVSRQEQSAEIEEQAEKIDAEDILSSPVNVDETETFVEPAVQDAEEVIEQTETKPADADDEDFMPEPETVDQKPEAIEPATVGVKETENPAAEVQTPQVKKEAAPVKTTETVKNADTASSIVTTTKTEQKQPVEKPEENSETPAAVQTSGGEVDLFKNLAVIEPSRSMKVKRNQFVDVVYPGNGWIYIGETETDPKFRYFGRKLGTENTVFTLRSIKAGKTYLHFYKNDVLTAQYIDDYLEVEVVNETAGNNEKATAPSYAEVVPPKPVRGVTTIEAETPEPEVQEQSVPQLPYKKAAASKKEESAKEQISSQPAQDDSRVKTIIQNTEEKTDSSLNNTIPAVTPSGTSADSSASSTETPAPEEKTPLVINTDPSKSLLDQAKNSLKNKKYQLALSQIRSYLDTANTKLDEAFYVQGQILEADSDVRNIRSAIDSYETVIKKYPASKFWNQANKRKIFLNRFYINIY